MQRQAQPDSPGASVASCAGLLVLAFATVAFGNSLQPIALLVYLEPACLLIAYDHLQELAGHSVRSRALAHICLVVTYALGFMIAFQSCFAFPDSNLLSWAITFGAGLLMGSAVMLIALLPQHLFLERFSFLPISLFAYPIMVTAAYTISGIVVGSFHFPATAVAEWPAMVQLTTVCGVAGVNFVVALIGTVLYHGCKPYVQQSPKLQRYLYGMGGVIALLLLICSGRVYTGAFYQKNITTQVGPQLQATCVIGQDVQLGHEDYLWMWKATAERVAAGDHFVLWSEEAVDVSTDEQEASLRREATELLRSTPGCRTFLGLAYERVNVHRNASNYWGRRALNKQQPEAPRTLLTGGEQDNDFDSASAAASTSGTEDSTRRLGPHKRFKGVNGRSALNYFVLFAPDGTIVFDYNKAFPVPVVESEIIPGPPEMPIVDTPYGRVGGAICFDFDHPGYIRQAGAARVDLLLQPSWTWSDLGPRHWIGNALRAAENGATLFRCSSLGVSGAVSPHGTFIHAMINGPRALLTVPINMQPRIDTLYANYGGWMAEWLNLLVALLMIVAAVLPRAWLEPMLTPLTRRMGDGSDGARAGYIDFEGAAPQHDRLRAPLRPTEE